MTILTRADKRSKTRRMAESNRNWTLFAAQIAFLILAGQQDHVGAGVCQGFGVVIHFLYLAFFTWTGWLQVQIFSI